MRGSASAALALACALLLAGCTGAASRAAGPVVEGTGYRFTAPEGWTEQEAQDGSPADVIAVDGEDADGFVDTITVLVAPSALTPEQFESQGLAQLEEAGATDVAVQDRVTAAGVEAAHLTGSTRTGDAEYRFDQYALSRDGRTCILVLASSPDLPEAEREERTGALLASWAWS